jgi:bleomycin hydrolase
MVFTGVSLGDKDAPSKFRVEHSLSDEASDDKTCLTMTSQWFKEFVFQIVIDQKLVNDSMMRIFDSEPVVLPAWDPIGNLAL